MTAIHFIRNLAINTALYVAACVVCVIALPFLAVIGYAAAIYESYDDAQAQAK